MADRDINAVSGFSSQSGIADLECPVSCVGAEVVQLFQRRCAEASGEVGYECSSPPGIGVDAERGRASGEGSIDGVRRLVLFVLMLLFMLMLLALLVLVVVVFFLFIVMVPFAFRVSRVIALRLDASSELNLESLEIQFF